MSIDMKTIEKLAMLSRLAFDDAAKEKMQGDLEKILEFVSQLQSVDTEGVEPMASTVSGQSTREREDVVSESEEDRKAFREEYLAPSPAQEMGFYVVPRVVE